MFTHLLITLDGSRLSESVLPYALGLAKQLRAAVTLVRVVPPDASAGEWGAVGKRRSAVSAAALIEAEAYLEHIAADARAGGIAVKTDTCEGDPAPEILKAARRAGADAIAIATHSRRGIDRLVFGSVAERVLHGTSLPVILLRAHAA